MGKKKSSQQHLQQSVGSLVSKAALSQMGPQIESMVRHYVEQLGENLAVQQASTLETLFSRVVVLESIVIEKLGYTAEQLTTLVADLQDEKEGLQAVETAELNDVVRIEVSTKTKDQTEFQGTSRMKVYKTGSGQTLGPELESCLIGMKTGETKEVSFGKDAQMTAKITLNKASRAIKTEANNDQSAG